MSDKSELPTPKKLEDARKKGQFPRSRLLTSSVVTLGALIGLYVSYETTMVQLYDWTKTLWSQASEMKTTTVVDEAWHLLARACAPILVGALMASVLVSLATIGFQWNPGLLSPKLERISPASGFRRLFTWKIWLELFKATVVAALITWMVWDKIQAQAPWVLRSTKLEGPEAVATSFSSLVPFLITCCGVLVALGVGDFFWAKRTHIKDLMMSREDVKREHKDAEGDPHYKGMRQAMHRQISASGPARGVSMATAVVVNPTHVAVALRYEPSEVEAPYLVAKGLEDDALRIRLEAAAKGIPVVRDVPLARSLIQCDVGDVVPEELYQAAAAILNVAWEQQNVGAHPKGEPS